MSDDKAPNTEPHVVEENENIETQSTDAAAPQEHVEQLDNDAKKKSEPHVAEKNENIETKATDAAAPQEHVEQLDAEEEEFRKLRRDLPGVKGTAASGIIHIGVAKVPGKNEFFRTHPHPDFQPVFDVVDHVAGLEKVWCVVSSGMVEPLASIGIIARPYRMYFTQTAEGKFTVVPVICEDADGVRNEYAATKEIVLREGMHGWVRLWTDQINRRYRRYPAPRGRFPDEVVWPELPAHKVFSLAFKSKGWQMDNTDHPLFLKWSARDKDHQ